MNESMETASDQQTIPAVLEGIASFKVKFDASDSSHNKTLFGNGRMQVKVQVLVCGVDANGNVVHIPTDVMESIELIHYNTGKTLRDGWTASSEQGRYTVEAPGSFKNANVDDEESEDDSVHPQVRTFWVSSAVAGTTQVAARLLLNGVKVLSNGTTLSSVHDSSVTLEAKTPVTYAGELFRWYQTRRGNEHYGNRIFNYYLGLYPHGQQIKLVDWVVDGVEGVDHLFAGGNKLNEPKTNYMKVFLARPETKSMFVSLPAKGDPVAYAFLPDAPSWNDESYHVRVNDRDGELTVMQALSEYSITTQERSKYGGNLHFTAIDEHGTEHKLAIRVNFYERNLYLERG
ncbi:hypothetical protein JRG42_05530 [Pseudomonas granadensis]|uniref:Uncharacterized protein n=1 Tax=Pseudomonas granadensis TaxID=1421430 RepID=A0ABX7GI57_9PSED|nr:hypothetical protein [Pseudomonas granadensis]MBN6772887.1 hypothetical protein [Pseudomonas granadensis]MBN6803927.1 hypothetical protein [Pseudomonas granadensis]MBN6830606.1 hypothetical protein [Pseudomonas granadensis]MBN6838148.1 hypothetical protein [Pseudomonas granadensis]MBN6867510.1 hypothetical protein [Pseudomonas granadensis]